MVQLLKNLIKRKRPLNGDVTLCSNYILCVIHSCKNLSQFYNCENLIKNFENLYKSREVNVDLEAKALRVFLNAKVNQYLQLL